MDRRQQRSTGTSRVGTLHGDDGTFDREFWGRIPPAERLALVWDMALEAQEWRGQSAGAPLHELTTADLAWPGTIFQIGVPPNRIDIVTAIDGVSFHDAWPERDETTYGDQVVPVIGRAHLVQNKRASGRPQDWLDLAVLGDGAE